MRRPRCRPMPCRRRGAGPADGRGHAEPAAERLKVSAGVRVKAPRSSNPMADASLHSPFAKPNSYVGRTLSRAGARRAVAGRGRYTDDISLPRMLHAAFVRSPLRARADRGDRHGRARSAAGRRPGHDGGGAGQAVHGPLGRHADLLSRHEVGAAVSDGRRSRLLGGRAGGHGGGAHPGRGRGRRRAREDRVAGAAGRGRQEDGAGSRIAGRSTPGSATTWPSARRSTPAMSRRHSPRPISCGGHLRVRPAHRRQPRVARRCSPQFDKGTGKLTITTSSQCPHMIQRVFAQTLGLPDHRVQIIAPDVGGSFGLKIHTYGDELAATAAAIRARPAGQVHRRPARSRSCPTSMRARTS